MFIIVALTKVIYGKCGKGHNLDSLDCYLINDYDCVSSFCTGVSSYFQANKDRRRLYLGSALKLL